jgi:hypothetical protein
MIYLDLIHIFLVCKPFLHFHTGYVIQQIQHAIQLYYRLLPRSHKLCIVSVISGNCSIINMYQTMCIYSVKNPQVC